MPVTPEYPELLLDLGEFLASRLERLGLTPEAAADEAFRLTEEVREYWGGQQPYIPKGLEFELSQKYQRIYERWKREGFTAQLSRDEDLCMRRIRQIVNLVRMQRRQKVDVQPLFPESASA